MLDKTTNRVVSAITKLPAYKSVSLVVLYVFLVVCLFVWAHESVIGAAVLFGLTVPSVVLVLAWVLVLIFSSNSMHHKSGKQGFVLLMVVIGVISTLSITNPKFAISSMAFTLVMSNFLLYTIFVFLRVDEALSSNDLQ